MSAEEYLRWKGRQLGLLDIGYHLLIEWDGRALLCRKLSVMGSHCPGFNHNSIGICLIGSQATGFPPEQITSLVSWLASLQARFPGALIKGHSELQRVRNGHRCPAIDMDQIRRRTSEYAPRRDEPPVPDRL